MLSLGALVIATIRDLRLRPTHRSDALLSWARCSSAVVLIAGPHLFIAAPHIYHYFIDNVFGRYAEIWRLQGDWHEQALYYLSGPGGKVMMGRSYYLSIIILIATITAIWYRKDRLAAWHVIYGLALAGLSFGLVTFPAMKTPFLGVSFMALVFCASVECQLFLARSARSVAFPHAKQIGATFLLIIAAATVLDYRPPWRNRLGYQLSYREISGHHHTLESAIAIVQQDMPNPAHIFVTGWTDYLNSPLIEFTLRRNGLRNVQARSLHESKELSAFKDKLDWANYVVAFSPDHEGLLPYLPSSAFQKEVSSLIESDSTLHLVTSLPNTLGRGTVSIYRRKA